MSRDDYVELDRRFVRCADTQDISPDLADWLIEHEQKGEEVYDWARLLGHGHVVILGEAGSGKTRELQARARILREQGRDAFFVAIEKIGPGSWPGRAERDRFDQWLATGDEGFFFLDAVDEAELRNKALDTALEHLTGLLGDAWPRARLILSSRVSDWRPYTHRTVVEQVLRGASLPGSFGDDSAQTTENQPGHELLVVQIVPLSTRQIALLAPRYGVDETDEFIEAIRGANAGIFAGRPGDLGRLARYWRQHGKLGTLNELIEHDVQEKLREGKPHRPERMNLALTDARKDIEDLAAAVVLCRRSMFSVRDESPPFESHDDALDPEQILPGRSREHIATLLDRPLFDPATYGRVQFHHRSIYEYLAACWLKRLLRDGCSRTRIEGFFIREVYGQKVIIPSMAPVAAWLAGSVDEIRDSVRDCAPEVLIEHGDPEQLPLPVREALLRQLAQKSRMQEDFWDYFDHASLRRFAHTDLAGVICELLADPELSDQFCILLFSLMQLGGASAGADTALRFALDESKANDARETAMEALSEIGSNAHIDDLASYAAELREGPPRVTAALCKLLFRHRRDVTELLPILLRAGQQALLATDSLIFLMKSLIQEDMSTQEALLFAERVTELLDVDMNREDGIPSERRWLLALLEHVLEKIIDQSLPETFPQERIRPVLALFRETDFLDEDAFEIHGILKRHPWFKRLSFWDAVAIERASKPKLTRYNELPWRVQRFHALSMEDVDWLLKDARELKHPLDRLLALDAACQILPGTGGFSRLEEVIKGDEQLSKRYERTLARTANLREIQWSNQNKYRLKALASTRRRERKQEENRQALLSRIQGIREGQDAGALGFLWNQMKESSSRWGMTDWQSLIPRFGQDIAEAARDGCKQFWRAHEPVLPHERSSDGRVPYAIILGLTGLAMDFAEGLEPRALPAEQVKIALRYALHEMNAFPDWLEKLAESWPGETREVFARALAGESKRDPAQLAYRDTWNRLGSLPASVRNIVAPVVLHQLITEPPQQGGHVRIALGALASTDEYGDMRLAEAGVRQLQDPNLTPETAATWWTTWLRLQPVAALDYLEKVRARDSGRFAQFFLMIARINGSSYDIRKKHHWPEALPVNVLERLVPMAYECIRPSDDIDRTNGGVYSPGPRDDQQHYRDRLVNQLASTAGSARALHELSMRPEIEPHRRWFLRLAHRRLGLDTEFESWSPKEIADFGAKHERSPASADDLFDIALERLADIRDEIERGDYSYRNLFTPETLEVEIQRWLASLLRLTSRDRYHAPREAEVDRGERTDIRLYVSGIAEYVTIEIKRAHKLGYPALEKALTEQLVGKYLRDASSRHGILLLCNMKPGRVWEPGDTGDRLSFSQTIQRLDDLARQVSAGHPHVRRLCVVGMDFTLPVSP